MVERRMEVALKPDIDVQKREGTEQRRTGGRTWVFEEWASSERYFDTGWYRRSRTKSDGTGTDENTHTRTLSSHITPHLRLPSTTDTTPSTIDGGVGEGRGRRRRCQERWGSSIRAVRLRGPAECSAVQRAVPLWGGEGGRGSMSRSRIAEHEWLQNVSRFQERGRSKYVHECGRGGDRARGPEAGVGGAEVLRGAAVGSLARYVSELIRRFRRRDGCYSMSVSAYSRQIEGETYGDGALGTRTWWWEPRRIDAGSIQLHH
ncbi:hypothetical protein DFP72DRAFT_853163 [Ephemerocybe angulata]|uniref:Uncharacterized protein n=1 Tax=Ephemerocybe angulata TaxID=980116 RepID=A0A8H6HLX3_9AGAR|nr:hypothetical protein DFP72DRAFT_853163 [Tulosesus angulatus]